MKMFNGEIDRFAKFLMDLDLAGRKSRMRTRFVKLLRERVELINEEHMEIVREYAHIGEDGQIKTKKVGNDEIFDMKDMAGFDKEYKDLMMEDFIIDQTVERKEMLETVRDVVLNTEMTFKGKEALIYDRFCEIVEEIDYK